MLKYILSALKKKIDFELTQAYLMIFLRVQGTELGSGDEEVKQLMAEISTAQKKGGERVLSLIDHSLSLIQYLSGQQAL